MGEQVQIGHNDPHKTIVSAESASTAVSVILVLQYQYQNQYLQNLSAVRSTVGQRSSDLPLLLGNVFVDLMRTVGEIVKLTL